MKKALLILVGTLVAGAIALCVMSGNAVRTVNALPITTPDWSTVADGEREGAYTCGPVSVRVRVIVRDHRLMQIDLLAHDNGFGKAAERIATDVVNAQSLEVDSVSGATVSSRSILRAVQLALEANE